MEIGIRDRCVKLILPNGKVVDVLTPVIEEMGKWVQDESYKPESVDTLLGISIRTLAIFHWNQSLLHLQMMKRTVFVSI